MTITITGLKLLLSKGWQGVLRVKTNPEQQGIINDTLIKIKDGQVFQVWDINQVEEDFFNGDALLPDELNDETLANLALYYPQGFSIAYSRS
jgi:hypothetical protein